MKYVVKHFDSTQFFGLSEQVSATAQAAHIPNHLKTIAEIKSYMTRNYKNGRTVLIFHAGEKEQPTNIAASFVIGINN